MDYIFRMPDGRRLALWSEGNQIVRMLSGENGSRRLVTLQRDFLSDFTAAYIDGRIYYAYQNISRIVMFYAPDGRDARLLFGESIESCRFGGLALTVWREELYLLYTAWNPIRRKYLLKVLKPLEMLGKNEEAELRDAEISAPVIQEADTRPELCLLSGPQGILAVSGENGWYLRENEHGQAKWQPGLWSEHRREREQLAQRLSVLAQEKEQLQADFNRLAQEKAAQNERLDRLSGELAESQRTASEYQLRLQSAVQQYNELAEVARQLQEEGKRWREKYFQKTKKSRKLPPA